MFTHKNLMTVSCAAVLAFGLAACGSSSDDDKVAATTTVVTDGVTDGVTAPSLVGKVIPAGTMFMLPEGSVPDIAVTVMEGKTLPVGDLGTFECVTGPCTVDIASDVVTITGVIEVVSLAEGLPAEVVTLLASAAVDPEAPAGPTPAQMTAAAATKETAIGVEADETGETDDAGLGGSNAPDTGDDGAYSLSIKRDRDGTTVEISLEGAEDDDPKFVQAMDFADGRTMHVRAIEADEDGNVVEEVVIVKTDIDAPKATPFADEHTLGINPNTADPPVNQSLTVNTENVAMWKADAFPSTPTTTRVYPQDNDATMDMNEGAFMGYFNGAPGTFECLIPIRHL